MKRIATIIFLLVACAVFAQEKPKEEPKQKTQIEVAQDELNNLQTKLNDLAKSIEQNQNLLNSQKAEAFDLIKQINQYSYYIGQLKPKEATN